MGHWIVSWTLRHLPHILWVFMPRRRFYNSGLIAELQLRLRSSQVRTVLGWDGKDSQNLHTSHIWLNQSGVLAGYYGWWARWMGHIYRDTSSNACPWLWRIIHLTHAMVTTTPQMPLLLLPLHKNSPVTKSMQQIWVELIAGTSRATALSNSVHPLQSTFSRRLIQCTLLPARHKPHPPWSATLSFQYSSHATLLKLSSSQRFPGVLWKYGSGWKWV